MLYHTPTHITDLTASPGWESLFLWLLTPFKPDTTLDSPIEEESGEDVISDIDDDFVIVSPVTYKDLKSYKAGNELSESASSNSLNPVPAVNVSGVEGVSGDLRAGDSVEGVSGDPQVGEGVEGASGHSVEVDVSDKLYPIPAVNVSGEADDSEAGGGVGSKGVGGAVHLRPHSPKRRPLSVPARNNIKIEDQSSTDDNMRRRSTAFLDSTTKGKRNIQVSGNKVVDQKNQRKLPLKKRGSLTYARSWSQQNEIEEEEARRTFSVVTETISYLLWHSVDYESGNPPWKVREEVL